MPKKKPANQTDWTTLSAFRVERGTVEKLDGWLEELNEGRRGPRLTRNDLIRGLLDWAGDTRPDWEVRNETSSKPKPRR